MRPCIINITKALITLYRLNNANNRLSQSAPEINPWSETFEPYITKTIIRTIFKSGNKIYAVRVPLIWAYTAMKNSMEYALDHALVMNQHP